MKKKHKQKLFLIVLIIIFFITFKTYVLFTPNKDDDEIPDELWQFAMILIQTK